MEYISTLVYRVLQEAQQSLKVATTIRMIQLSSAADTCYCLAIVLAISDPNSSASIYSHLKDFKLLFSFSYTHIRNVFVFESCLKVRFLQIDVELHWEWLKRTRWSWQSDYNIRKLWWRPRKLSKLVSESFILFDIQ